MYLFVFYTVLQLWFNIHELYCYVRNWITNLHDSYKQFELGVKTVNSESHSDQLILYFEAYYSIFLSTLDWGILENRNNEPTINSTLYVDNDSEVHYHSVISSWYEVRDH